MLKRLTAKYVERLHVKKRAEIWDAQTHGLILRVAAGGVKSWCVLGYLRGSRRRVRIGIGRFPRWSLADARQEAGRILQELDRGRMRHRRGDPETDPTATVEALGNACVRAVSPRWRDSTRRECIRLFRRVIVPAWGDRAPSSIERRDVRDWLDRITPAAPVAAVRAFEFLRRVFSWGNEQDLITVNPCAGVRPPHRCRPRDRVLTTEEIRKTWTAASGIGSLGSAVRLLLLTAARRGEVLGMRWADVDLPARMWRIPGEARKGGQAHAVPLTPPAVRILEAIRKKRKGRLGRPRSRKGADWVFPSRDGEGPVRNPQALARRLKAKTGIKDATLHDLRRTVATRLGELGSAPAVVEAILGHARPALVATYQRYLPLPEMRDALTHWAEWLAVPVRK